MHDSAFKAKVAFEDASVQTKSEEKEACHGIP